MTRDHRCGAHHTTRESRHRSSSVHRVLRRSMTIALALPLAAALVAGCSTFSDSGNVARVEDVALTDDDFQALLTELGAPEDQLLPAEAIRAQITTWIQEQLATAATAAISEDEIAEIYNAGVTSAPAMCLSVIVVADEDAATRVAAELTNGADFALVFAAENLDETLDPSAGDLGCITSDQVAQAADVEFVQVAAGLSGDNQLGTASLLDAQGAVFSWVVMDFQTFDELSSENAGLVSASVAAAAQLANADIFVNPRYGRFDVATGQVVALS